MLLYCVCRVRRPRLRLQPSKTHKDLRRTVFVYGIAPDKANEAYMIKLLQEFGKIQRVIFEEEGDVLSEAEADVDVDVDIDSEAEQHDEAEASTTERAREAVAVDGEDDKEAEVDDDSVDAEAGPDRELAQIITKRKYTSYSMSIMSFYYSQMALSCAACIC